MLTEDEVPSHTSRDRRHAPLRDIVGAVVLIMNFGGLVWGAATMSGSVTQLKESVDDLRGVAKDLSGQMSSIREDYGARIRILELQLGDLKKGSTK